MDDLVAFLRDRYAEEERIAKAATGGPWSVDSESYAESIDGPNGVTVVGGGRWGGEASVFASTEDALHIAAWDPARVLAEVEAKRAIVAEYEQADRYSRVTWGQSSADQSRARTLGKVAALLALPYTDHPEYQEAWRP
jgi:hypothetical protein